MHILICYTADLKPMRNAGFRMSQTSFNNVKKTPARYLYEKSHFSKPENHTYSHCASLPQPFLGKVEVMMHSPLHDPTAPPKPLKESSPKKGHSASTLKNAPFFCNAHFRRRTMKARCITCYKLICHPEKSICTDVYFTFLIPTHSARHPIKTRMCAFTSMQRVARDVLAYVFSRCWCSYPISWHSCNAFKRARLACLLHSHGTMQASRLVLFASVQMKMRSAKRS